MNPKTPGPSKSKAPHASTSTGDSKSPYGGRGRPWHPNFIKYMEFIVAHPAYGGMPDVFYEPGRIQWEAPSNRLTGRFKDTHTKRLKWWAVQANRLGISTSSDKWISRVAKRIHPTGKKPCKICGRELDIRYVYPSARFLRKVRSLPFVKKAFPLDPLEPVHSLVARLVAKYGNAALASMSALFRTTHTEPPVPPPANLTEWLAWLDTVFIPSEPRGILSPGVMANPPDRLDGFHCDNLCCRGTADIGRHKPNLKGYATDRRVFEYWTSGDWVAADRLMGRLRAEFPNQACRHGHAGPCAADHIGPISLGFTHRPQFQLLCSSCNSAKNNRMYRSDVVLLQLREQAGEEVVSWHTIALWNACKGRVQSDEHARRLSKMMRDNRHSLMHALHAIADSGAYAFLASLLELERANYDVVFVNLRIDEYLTLCDNIEHTPRITKYAVEQKTRRCRIAFAALLTYFEKSNRNSFIVRTSESDRLLQEVLATLTADAIANAPINKALMSAAKADKSFAEAAFRDLLPQIAAVQTPAFKKAAELLRRHMDAIGAELATHWESERYVRELGGEDGLEL